MLEENIFDSGWMQDEEMRVIPTNSWLEVLGWFIRVGLTIALFDARWQWLNPTNMNLSVFLMCGGGPLPRHSLRAWVDNSYGERIKCRYGCCEFILVKCCGLYMSLEIGLVMCLG